MNFEKYNPFERRYTDWEKTFIIFPRRIDGKIVFFRTVYKRISYMIGFPHRAVRYEYASIFGVLKS